MVECLRESAFYMRMVQIEGRGGVERNEVRSGLPAFALSVDTDITSSL